VLVSPAADVFATFTNVMRLAHDDLAEAKPGIASAIAGCLERTAAVLDDAMREGLLNVLHDDRLFTHYWSDAEQFRASMAAQARPEAQFDVESFFAVLGDFAGRGAARLSSDAIRCPALAIFGADDRVTRHAEQRQAVMAAVPHARIDVFDGCSHYLHLDRPEGFLDTVVSWASSKAL
jgi:pimeloyl-ACP methyl ester carboxylesterase